MNDRWVLVIVFWAFIVYAGFCVLIVKSAHTEPVFVEPHQIILDVHTECLTDEPHPVIVDGEPHACFWDAGARGDGKGHSFIVDKHGEVDYIDPLAPTKIAEERQRQ